MEECFRPVLQLTIIKCYLASWAKSVRQRLQEILLRGDPGKVGGNAVAEGRPELTIKFSSEAVTDKV